MSIERVRCAYCREIVATVDTDTLKTPLCGAMFTPLHFELGGHPMFSEHSDWQSLFCVKNAVLHPGAHRIVKEDGVIEFEDGAFWMNGEIVGRAEPADLWQTDPDLDAEWKRRMKATTQTAEEIPETPAKPMAKRGPGRPRKHDPAPKKKPGRPSKKKKG